MLFWFTHNHHQVVRVLASFLVLACLGIIIYYPLYLRVALICISLIIDDMFLISLFLIYIFSMNCLFCPWPPVLLTYLSFSMLRTLHSNRDVWYKCLTTVSFVFFFRWIFGTLKSVSFLNGIMSTNLFFCGVCVWKNRKFFPNLECSCYLWFLWILLWFCF
jgi:hypothetical protein